MANTLTSLIPDAYAALDVVSRELVGFIPSVSRDPRADRVALNQTLRSFATQANTGGFDISPAMSIPTIANQTIQNKSLTITKVRAFPFSWSGEEQYSVNQGPGYLNIKQDQIAQAMRAAVNAVELDIANAAYLGASRATGTAGSTPFNSNLADPANVRKILDDNGTPESDRHLVINTTAGAALRTLTQLTKANEAADTTMLRQGALLDVHGFQIRESAQIGVQSAGTSTTMTTDGSAYPVGSQTITLITGTGTVLAGDVVTFAGDTNKYVVATGTSGAGPITLAAPGLVQALPASVKAMTITAAAARNCAFSRNAILLATRLPAVPENGDMALDRATITDPRSGISFEIAMYPGYRMVTYHVSIAWGVTVLKPEHLAILLG
jgi:hypothetical protein